MLCIFNDDCHDVCCRHFGKVFKDEVFHFSAFNHTLDFEKLLKQESFKFEFYISSIEFFNYVSTLSIYSAVLEAFLAQEFVKEKL